MKIIAVGVALYLVYCGVLFLFQRQIIFPSGKAGPIAGSGERISGLEKLTIDTTSGKVEAWFLPAENNLHNRFPVAIFAHGNAELIDYWPESLWPLTKIGISVLLVEYPGYGRSFGKSSQKRITEVFVRAYDLLVARNDIDSERIVYIGRSIGGGVVCSLAREREPAAMVLMSTFTSLRAMARKFLVPGMLLQDHFDNIDVLRSFSKPVLVVHGKKDNLVDYDHGVALSKAAPNGRLISYEAGHNDCPPDWKVFYRDIEVFLKESGILKKK